VLLWVNRTIVLRLLLDDDDDDDDDDDAREILTKTCQANKNECQLISTLVSFFFFFLLLTERDALHCGWVPLRPM
jgi:hypothetical protein